MAKSLIHQVSNLENSEYFERINLTKQEFYSEIEKIFK